MQMKSLVTHFFLLGQFIALLPPVHVQYDSDLNDVSFIEIYSNILELYIAAWSYNVSVLP